MIYGYAFVMPPPPVIALESIEIMEVKNSMALYKMEELVYWMDLKPKMIAEASGVPCDRVARAMMPDIKKAIALFHKRQGRLRRLL